MLAKRNSELFHQDIKVHHRFAHISPKRKQQLIMAATLEHASLGQIKGIKPSQHPELDQYLGIQYATLADAFSRGKPIEKPQAPIDATAKG